jgi:hypothetical protein
VTAVRNRSRLVRDLHASDWQGAFLITGGGSLLLAELLPVPGASATVLDAEVPYSAARLTQVLGSAPEQAASAGTASDLATVAFERALDLTRNGAAPDRLFGMGITASLRTRAPKRGHHRAYIALQTVAASHRWHLALAKGARTRLQEERLLRDVALSALGAGLPLDARLPVAVRPPDGLTTLAMHASRDWQELMLRRVPAVAVGPPRRPAVLYPGAFNPLHDGHRAIAAYARRKTDGDVAFELCANNIDKPRLNYLALHERLSQFDPGTPVWVTNLPTFREKARYFPGVTFLVGVDTMARIGQLRYYGNDTARFHAAMHEIQFLGCRFLVFGRKLGSRFVTLADLALPPSLDQICDEVPEAEFRMDASSTMLRQTGNDESAD